METRFGAVIRAITEHPKVWEAKPLAEYAGMSLEMFSDTYRELVVMGHLAKGGPIHGLTKKKPIHRVKPTQDTLFEIETRPREKRERPAKARADLSYMIPKEEK